MYKIKCLLNFVSPSEWPIDKKKLHNIKFYYSFHKNFMKWISLHEIIKYFTKWRKVIAIS